jgi:PAS domain S-box-containing protein
MVANLGQLEDPLAVLKALAVHAPVGLQIYDAGGYTLFVNEAHRRIFGATPPPTYSVLRDSHAEQTGVLPLIRRAFAGEATALPLTWYDPRELTNLSPEDAAYVKQHGKAAAIETHLIPVLDRAGQVSYVVFIFKDVTSEALIHEQQQRTLKERDDAQVQFESLLENTRAVVYVKDLEGRYLFANEQFSRIFAQPVGYVLGKRDHEIFSEEVADKFRENDFQVLSSQTHLEAEEVAMHSDGTFHTYISLKFPLKDSRGAPRGLCGISTDITEYRRMERELSSAKRMEAVGLLAGGIAHDFNNILAIIMMVADTLTMTDSAVKPDLQKSMSVIKDAGQRAAALTRSLLAFGRRQKFQPRVLDPGKIIRDLENILHRAVGEDIRLTVDLAPDLWPVTGHPSQIDQILTNLAFNAHEAMPRGGTLTITGRNTTLQPSPGPWKIGRPSGEFIELTVADTGIGIAPAIMDRIFEPFFTTKQEGLRSGLGLATVYGIVQDLGGDIAVESEPGVGATFRIYLPRSDGAAAPSPVKPASALTALRGTETILLVEDQDTLRGITATFLRERGFTVHEARSAPAALALWPGISREVRLVISDIVMPGQNGIELAQALLRAGAPENLKLLFISGYSDRKLSECGFDRAKYQLLEKPYGAAGLLSAIREVLDLPG